MPTSQTVFVTGATSGIGRACAVAFDAAGYRVIATGRDEQRLAELAEELIGDCHTLAMDLRDGDRVATAIASLPDDWSTIDVLVNSAGMAVGRKPLHEMAAEDSAKVVETNVTGLLRVTQAILPAMVARGEGHVIDIGSNAGRGGYPGGAVYSATKAAVDRITRGMRMDLLGTGLRVSTVDPGMVETEFNTRRFGDAEQAAKLYEGMTPLQADDVADAVLWVATRPAHVQIAEILIFPTDQAGSGHVARRPSTGP